MWGSIRLLRTWALKGSDLKPGLGLGLRVARSLSSAGCYFRVRFTVWVVSRFPHLETVVIQATSQNWQFGVQGLAAEV